MKNYCIAPLPPIRGKLHKIFTIMKLSLFLTFAFLLQLQANVVISQGSIFSITYEETDIKSILKEVEAQTDYRFFYSEDLKYLDSKITLDIRDYSLEQALEVIMEDLPISYQVFDNKLVVIVPEEAAQGVRVTGKVSDEDGVPIPGANIIEEGTANGTITDAAGSYSLELSSGSAVLVFSFVGYQSYRVEVADQTSINVVLQADLTELDEVVVVGYGTIKKSDLTGAVSSVKSEELMKSSASSVSQALQGRVPGVRVINYAGPGQGSTIRIRGISTINNAEPLYVIDGFPTGGMNHLAPTDIESIEVLKDASATAIYGSRGANGVVLITTKTGRFEGKPTVNVNLYAGTVNGTGRYDMLDATQYATLYKEALANDGMEPGEQLGAMMDFIQANNLKGTDWQDEFIRPGINQSYNVSITGGSEKSAYDIGATYTDETGIVKKGFSRKLFLHANNDYKISDRIKVGTKINYHTNNSNFSGPFDGIQKEPMVPAWDSYTNNYGVAQVFDNPNPARVLDFNSDYYLSSPAQTFRGKVYLQIDDLFLKGLSFNSLFGTSLDNFHYKRYTPEYYVSGLEYNSESSLSEERSQNTSWAFTNYLNYNGEFNGHGINMMLGMEAQKWNSSSLGANVFNIPDNENLYYVDAAIEKERMGVSGGAGHSALASYYARLNYNYKGRYLLTATWRADGSSKFIDDYRWGYFPSFSLGWNLMEEAFMESASGVFNSLKIRGGWGRVGNQSSASNNAYTALVYSGYKTVFGLNQTIYDGSVQLNVLNPNIHWEVAEQTNIGLNFSSLGNRLSGTFDWFMRDTKDMIISMPIPYYAGQRRPVVNSATMRNSGIEFDLGYRGGNPSEFSYGVGANFSYIKNEVTNMAEPIMPQKSTRTEEGMPMAYFYGYQTDGIVNDQAELDAYLMEVPNNNNAELGDVMFIDQVTVDVDGDGVPDEKDGVINGEDRVFIGNPWPAFVFGLDGDFAYKNFDLSVFFNGELDKDVWNEMAEGFEKTRMTGGNMLASRMDRWTPDNPNSDQPRMDNGDPNQNSRANDRYIEDASFLRLKSLQLGYTLPERASKRIGMSHLRLYVSCENVFTITKYSGLNPEIGFSYGSSVMPGFDSGAYPTVRTLLIGANIKF